MCSKRKADEFFDRENAKHNRRINDFYQTSPPEDSANEMRDDSKENHSDLNNSSTPGPSRQKKQQEKSKGRQIAKTKVKLSRK